MAMTKAQQSYAIGKINTIVDAKVKETQEAEGWPRVSLTSRQKHQLIVSGEVKLKEDISNATPVSLSEYQATYFDFSKHEKAAGISKKGQARIDKLLVARGMASDEVMLGDSAEALALLKTIESL
jgi:hypothetical protein